MPIDPQVQAFLSGLTQQELMEYLARQGIVLQPPMVPEGGAPAPGAPQVPGAGAPLPQLPGQQALVGRTPPYPPPPLPGAAPSPAQVPIGVGTQAAMGPETSVNPALLAGLDRFMANPPLDPRITAAVVGLEDEPAPARPLGRSATTRSSRGADPATFARPVEATPGTGGFGARFREMWRANKGNNQKLALERMIAGNRGTR